MYYLSKALEFIIYYFAYSISYIFPYQFISKITRHVITTLYTGYVSRFFKKFGKGSIVQPTFSLLLGAEYIEFGNNCNIAKNIQLTAWDSYMGQTFKPEIIIGNNCLIGEDAHITAINSIHIGNNVLMGKKVLITDNSHGASTSKMMDISPAKRPLYSKGPVIIDDNVWVGEKVSIMPGVHIGECAIIAANAVVTKDIPAYSVAAGIPAKVVRSIRLPN